LSNSSRTGKSKFFCFKEAKEGSLVLTVPVGATSVRLAKR
jgi:hypothetical protein